jgi:ribosomal protein S12 methylthiotransferase accessory factor YcaO
MINRIAGDDVEIVVLDMNDPEIAETAKSLGVRCGPAVAVNGAVAECCQECAPDEEIIRKVLEMNR